MARMLLPGSTVEITWSPSPPDVGQAVVAYGLVGEQRRLNGLRGVTADKEDKGFEGILKGTMPIDFGPAGVHTLPTTRFVRLQASACVDYATEARVAELQKQADEALRSARDATVPEDCAGHAQSAAAALQQLAAARVAVAPPQQGVKVATHGLNAQQSAQNGRVGVAKELEPLPDGGTAVCVRVGDKIIKTRPSNLVALP